MNKYKYILIDGNNLFFRSVYLAIQKNVIQNIEIQTGAIKYAIDKIRDLIDIYGYENSTIIYILFDNTESKINLRKIISEGHYKHSREKQNLPDNFYHSLNIFEEVLKNYSNNYRVSFSQNLEADDLVRPILKNLVVNENNKALIISVDMDWARNISPNVHWFDWKNVYDYVNFELKYKFSPLGNKVQIYKALHGDKADNIENVVPYLPKENLLHLVNKYNDIYDLLDNIHREEIISKDWKEKIKQNRSKILINYELADFIEVDRSLTDIVIKCEENIKGLRLWFNLLNLEFEERMELKENKGSIFFSKRDFI